MLLELLIKISPHTLNQVEKVNERSEEKNMTIKPRVNDLLAFHRLSS